MPITTNAQPRALAPSLLRTVLPTRAGPRFIAFAMARNAARTLDQARQRRRPLDTIGPQALPEAGYHPVYPAESFTLSRPAGFSDADWTVFQLRNVDRVPPSFVLDIPGASVVGHEAWIRAPSGAFVKGIWSEAGFPLAEMVPPHLRGNAPPALRLDGTTARRPAWRCPGCRTTTIGHCRRCRASTC